MDFDFRSGGITPTKQKTTAQAQTPAPVAAAPAPTAQSPAPAAPTAPAAPLVQNPQSAAQPQQKTATANSSLPPVQTPPIYTGGPTPGTTPPLTPSNGEPYLTTGDVDAMRQNEVWIDPRARVLGYGQWLDQGVGNIYKNEYGRAARDEEAATLNMLRDKLARGEITLEQLASEYNLSPEGQSYNSVTDPLDDRMFVQRALGIVSPYAGASRGWYQPRGGQQVMERDLAALVDRLEGGMDREDFIEWLRNSADYKENEFYRPYNQPAIEKLLAQGDTFKYDLRNDELEQKVFAAFKQEMGRDPTERELKKYADAARNKGLGVDVTDTSTPEDVARTFFRSLYGDNYNPSADDIAAVVGGLGGVNQAMTADMFLEQYANQRRLGADWAQLGRQQFATNERLFADINNMRQGKKKSPLLEKLRARKAAGYADGGRVRESVKKINGKWVVTKDTGGGNPKKIKTVRRDGSVEDEPAELEPAEYNAGGRVGWHEDFNRGGRVKRRRGADPRLKGLKPANHLPVEDGGLPLADGGRVEGRAEEGRLKKVNAKKVPQDPSLQKIRTLTGNIGVRGRKGEEDEEVQELADGGQVNSSLAWRAGNSLTYDPNMPEWLRNQYTYQDGGEAGGPGSWIMRDAPVDEQGNQLVLADDRGDVITNGERQLNEGASARWIPGFGWAANAQDTYSTGKFEKRKRRNQMIAATIIGGSALAGLAGVGAAGGTAAGEAAGGAALGGDALAGTEMANIYAAGANPTAFSGAAADIAAAGGGAGASAAGGAGAATVPGDLVAGVDFAVPSGGSSVALDAMPAIQGSQSGWQGVMRWLAQNPERAGRIGMGVAGLFQGGGGQGGGQQPAPYTPGAGGTYTPGAGGTYAGPAGGLPAPQHSRYTLGAGGTGARPWRGYASGGLVRNNPFDNVGFMDGRVLPDGTVVGRGDPRFNSGQAPAQHGGRYGPLQIGPAGEPDLYKPVDPSVNNSGIGRTTTRAPVTIDNDTGKVENSIARPAGVGSATFPGMGQGGAPEQPAGGSTSAPAATGGSPIYIGGMGTSSVQRGPATGGAGGVQDPIRELMSLGREQIERYRRYSPLENQIIDEARRAGGAQEQEEFANEALEGASQQFDRERGRLRRTPGIDPARAAALESQLAVGEGGARAYAANQARRGARDRGFGMRIATIGLGDQALKTGLGAVSGGVSAALDADRTQAGRDAAMQAAAASSAASSARLAELEMQRQMERERMAQQDRQFNSTRGDRRYEFDETGRRTDRSFDRGVYTNDRDFDYGVWRDDRNFSEDVYRNRRNFDYDVYRYNNGLMSDAEAQAYQRSRQRSADIGSGVRTAVDVGSGIYNAGSSFGWWADGGRVPKGRARGLPAYNAGGKVQSYDNGGEVGGVPHPNPSVDTVPAMLRPGEGVVNAEGMKILDKVAPGLFDMVNKRGLEYRNSMQSRAAARGLPKLKA